MDPLASPASNAFLDYVIGVACDRVSLPANPENIPTANIALPSDFLRFFFAALDDASRNPITRTGTEAAAEIVFGHPDIQRFLGSNGNKGHTLFYDEIRDEILPRSSTLFRDHWNYIIGPIWDEHTQIACVSNPVGETVHSW